MSYLKLGMTHGCRHCGKDRRIRTFCLVVRGLSVQYNMNLLQVYFFPVLVDNNRRIKKYIRGSEDHETTCFI